MSAGASATEGLQQALDAAQASLAESQASLTQSQTSADAAAAAAEAAQVEARKVLPMLEGDLLTPMLDTDVRGFYLFNADVRGGLI